MYRKVDVDTLIGDEDEFMEQEFQFKFAEIQSQTNEKEGNVKQAISRNDFTTALRAALQNPPYGNTEITDLKRICDDLVYKSLAGVRSQDIDNVISSLSAEQGDVLMKYLYKLMANPALFNPTILLAWHEKLVQTLGHAPIIRCLTDRKNV